MKCHVFLQKIQDPAKRQAHKALMKAFVSLYRLSYLTLFLMLLCRVFQESDQPPGRCYRIPTIQIKK